MLVHTVWLIYEELALSHIGTPSIFTLVQTVIGTMFALMLLNSALRRWKPKWVLTPPEFMVVFAMMTIGAVVTSVKLLHYLFPTILWPSYMPIQSGGPTAASNLASFLGPREPRVVEWFFVGTRSFWAFFRPEILRAWLVPLGFWAAFFFLLLWTMLCLASLVRRPWVDQDKVPFPVIELPVMMARDNDAKRLFSNRLLLLGFVPTVLLLSENYLGSLFPGFPTIKLAEQDIGTPYLTSAPWSSVNPLLAVWWPYALGLCYLIPLDVLFSCWFFFVAFRLVLVIATAVGWRSPGSAWDLSQFPYVGNAAEGAWLGMFLAIVWNARRFLSALVRAMLRRQPVPGDAEEAMPYRLALIGTAAGYGALVWLGVLAGMRLSVSLVAFALFFLAIVVLTRMYAQVAMPLFCMAFFSFTSWTTALFGTANLTRPEMASLTTFYWFDRTYETIPMGHHMEAFVFADRLRQSRRAMFWVVLGTTLVAVVIGMVTLLQIFYDRGAASARVSQDSTWLAGYAWSRYAEWTASPKAFEAAPILRGAVSAAIVLLLSYARTLWIGFPLHPIGYLFTVSFALEWGMWNIVFVTWLVKWLIVRYGGLRAYRRSVSFFLGLALGDAVAHFVWGVGLSLAGARGASPY